MYKVKLENFQGPLDLLLKLCQEEKLEINKISLAKIADQYLEEITKVDSSLIRPEELADFLVVAAQLLFIKSKLLLPYLVEDDQEEQAVDLEEKLKRYREYLELADLVRQQINQRQFSFFRAGLPYRWEELLKERIKFISTEVVEKDAVFDIFKELIASLEKIQVKIPHDAIKRVVSLETKIKTLKELLERGTSLCFKDFANGSSKKLDVVLAFLAVLELVKQRYLNVEQQEMWGDIVINRNHNDQVPD